jgi:hypothetical protein
VQRLVLRHELPDFFDHRIIARNELIARVSGCPVACRAAVSPAAAFYRASGLVLWRKVVINQQTADKAESLSFRNQAQ